MTSPIHMSFPIAQIHDVDLELVAQIRAVLANGGDEAELRRRFGPDVLDSDELAAVLSLRDAERLRPAARHDEPLDLVDPPDAAADGHSAAEVQLRAELAQRLVARLDQGERELQVRRAQERALHERRAQERDQHLQDRREAQAAALRKERLDAASAQDPRTARRAERRLQRTLARGETLDGLVDGGRLLPVQEVVTLKASGVFGAMRPVRRELVRQNSRYTESLVLERSGTGRFIVTSRTLAESPREAQRTSQPRQGRQPVQETAAQDRSAAKPRVSERSRLVAARRSEKADPDRGIAR